MDLTDEHWEYFIDLVIHGTYQPYASNASTHGKRPFTENRFEDALVNSFIGFVSETAFECHAEEALEEAIAIDGGWFISRESSDNPIEDATGVYVTTTARPLARLENLYRKLAREFEGHLFALERKESFRLRKFSREQLRAISIDDVFDFYRFKDDEFQKASPQEFSSLFEQLDQRTRDWRSNNQQATVGEAARAHIRKLVDQMRSYPADHEARFLDRLFVDRWFSPHFKKGNLSDIDAVLDFDQAIEILDVKCKLPFGVPPRYGLNKYKLDFFSKVDSWNGFSSYYVVNRNELKNLNKRAWIAAPMTKFKDSSFDIEGGSGRTNNKSETTIALEVSEFEPVFAFSDDL